MNEQRYAIKDLVLPRLAEQGRLRQPGFVDDICPVEVRVTETHIFLRVGPRDWRWDRATSELVGSGVSLACPPVHVEGAVDVPTAP